MIFTFFIDNHCWFFFKNHVKTWQIMDVNSVCRDVLLCCDVVKVWCQLWPLLTPYRYLCIDKYVLLVIVLWGRKRLQIIIVNVRIIVQVLVGLIVMPRITESELRIYFINPAFRLPFVYSEINNVSNVFIIQKANTKLSVGHHDKCEGRIRCHGGVSILCWPVTPVVSPILKSVSQDQ
jgi:hypothetical protein